MNPTGRLAPYVFSCVFAAVGLHGAWGGSNAIAISATSAPGYIRPTDPQGQPLPETYVFMESGFMGGNTADNSQTRITFSELTKILAVNLAKQSYYPTTDLPAANLLIRIFWGTTSIVEDPDREQAIQRQNEALQAYMAAAAFDSGNADPGALNAEKERLASAQNSAMAAVERNAALLGYRRSLDKERQKAMPTPEELAMSIELNEERYFVVLMAYDYQFMRREKKPKLLWVTRLSMRSPGNNLVEALPALAFAGADIYGRSLDGLQRVRVNDREVEVKMGELQVMGTVEDKELETKGK
jgi:hypothetical protein